MTVTVSDLSLVDRLDSKEQADLPGLVERGRQSFPMGASAVHVLLRDGATPVCTGIWLVAT